MAYTFTLVDPSEMDTDCCEVGKELRERREDAWDCYQKVGTDENREAYERACEATDDHELNDH